MKTVLCLFLAVIIFFTCLTACKGGTVNENDGSASGTNSETVATPVTLDIIKEGKTDFTLIYPKDASKDVINAVTNLTETFRVTFGIVIMPLTDDLIEPCDTSHEILIGRTNRAETTTAVAALEGCYDYFVGVIGNKLVLTGKGDDEVANAVFYLINNYIEKLPEEELEAKRLSYSGEQNYTYKASYPFADLKLFGKSVKEFNIVVPAEMQNRYTLFAKELAVVINRLMGVSPQIIKDTESTGAYEFLVGNTSRSTVTVDRYEYAITVKGDCVEFSAESVLALERMLAEAQTLLLSGKLADASKKDCGEIKRVDISTLANAAKSPAFNKEGDLRVMVHNIWGWGADVDQPIGQRNQFHYDTYMEYAPDILCLQEVTSQVRNEEQFPLITNLCQAGYAEVAVGKVNGLETGTPILYRPDVARVIDKGIYKFTGDGAADDKFITWAVFEILDGNRQGTGKTMGVISVHLAYQSGMVGDTYRAAQIPKVIEVAKEIAGQNGCSVMICGDMNCTISSEPYKLYVDAGIKNVFDQFSKDAEGNNPKCDNYKSRYNYPKMNPDTGLLEKTEKTPGGTYSGAIDHALFFGNGFEFGCFRIMATDYTMRGSDHAPILVDFSLKGGLE